VLVRDRYGITVTRLKLVEQRQWIVIVDEARMRFAGVQRVERAEDRRVTKALGDAARIEAVDAGGGQVNVGVRVHRRMWPRKGGGACVCAEATPFANEAVAPPARQVSRPFGIDVRGIMSR
jgi:hypothetical protein